ncbi:MAG: DoxX family protein [Verrucomicrobiia bacterium]
MIRITKLFAPGNDSTLTSLGLLMLRLWLGLAMFFNHGFDKLIHFEYAANFPDPLGIGVTTSLALVTFAETAGALLLALGILTRFAAMTLVIDLAVAVFMVHKAASGAGELAFVYLAGYIALLLAGGGKFSADKALFGKRRNPGTDLNLVGLPATDTIPA